MKKFLAMLAAAVICHSAAADAVKVVLFPFREAVISSQVESKLGAYRFRIGQAFKAGDLLVKADDAKFQLLLARAEKELEFHEQNYKNRQELLANNLTSEFEVKKAEFDKNMALFAKKEAGLYLEYCNVKAPFDGKIQEIICRDFESVRPGQPLCRIIDDNTLIAVLNVPMNDRKMTAIGNSFKIKLDSGEIIQAVVHEVFPQADHRTGTVRIRAKIDNRDGKLISGATGEVYYDK